MPRFARLLAFLASVSLPIFAAEPESAPPPDLTRASVTIPYSELRNLWEAGQARKEITKPETAPVGHLVHRADLVLRIGDGMASLEAAYEVEMLDAKWQTIPLLAGDARLEKVEAGGRPVIWQEGYSLLSNEPGKSRVVLQLAAPDIRQGLRLRLGSAAIKRLEVAGIPAGLAVRVNDRAAVETKDGVALFSLPGESGEITITLAAQRPEKIPQPSRWQAQSQVLVQFAEGRLRFFSRIAAHTDGGSGLEMTLALPGNASAVTVLGEDLAEWTQVRTDDGRRLVQVKWKTADVLDRELAIGYAVPQSPLAEEWKLHAPAVADEADSRHLFAIVAADGVELKGDGLRAAVASRRLPEWMRSEIGGVPFVTAEAGPLLTVQAVWLPVIATAEAIVSEARGQLRVVADGSMQTSLSYTIRHAAPLAWRLELPAEVELLSCQVAGQPARPIRREDGGVELNLPAPVATAKGVTQVALVYAAKTAPFDPVSGQTALELPRTPLFIERLEWQVAIPAAFEITAIDGNVATAGSAKIDRERGEQTVSLRKDLCRGERPKVALFYQRQGLGK